MILVKVRQKNRISKNLEVYHIVIKILIGKEGMFAMKKKAKKMVVIGKVITLTASIITIAEFMIHYIF